MNLLCFARYQQDAQYINVNGHNIAFWQSFTGALASDAQTILFLHGFPSASSDWHYLWKILAKDYHLLCVDMLGFGLTDKPKKHRYSLIEQADICETILAELQIEDFHILAHDYGVSVAQELLFRHNQRPHSQYSACKAGNLKSICFLNGGFLRRYIGLK